MTIREIKAERKRIREAMIIATSRVSRLQRLYHKLQDKCKHPFSQVRWHEWIPAGLARGTCEACGYNRCYSTDYSEKELSTVEFVFKK